MTKCPLAIFDMMLLSVGQHLSVPYKTVMNAFCNVTLLWLRFVLFVHKNIFQEIMVWFTVTISLLQEMFVSFDNITWKATSILANPDKPRLLIDFNYPLLQYNVYSD